MSVGENQEQPGTGSGAEQTGGQGPKGTTRPSTPYEEEKTHRTGSELDIRSTGGEEDDREPTPPPDNLRDGT